MGIEITNSSAFGAKTFIRTPSNSDLKVDGCMLYNGETFLDIYEPQTLGLPAEVTKDDLREVFASLRDRPEQSQEEFETVVKASTLSKWLITGNQVTQFASGAIALFKAGYDLVK